MRVLRDICVENCSSGTDGSLVLGNSTGGTGYGPVPSWKSGKKRDANKFIWYLSFWAFKGNQRVCRWLSPTLTRFLPPRGKLGVILRERFNGGRSNDLRMFSVINRRTNCYGERRWDASYSQRGYGKISWKVGNIVKIRFIITFLGKLHLPWSTRKKA